MLTSLNQLLHMTSEQCNMAFHVTFALDFKKGDRILHREDMVQSGGDQLKPVVAV